MAKVEYMFAQRLSCQDVVLHGGSAAGAFQTEIVKTVCAGS